MASSGGREHVGKGDVPLVPVPRGRFGNKILGGRELLDKPKDHEGVGPVCEHRSTKYRVLPAALWVGGTRELLGLPVIPMRVQTCDS